MKRLTFLFFIFFGLTFSSYSCKKSWKDFSRISLSNPTDDDRGGNDETNDNSENENTIVQDVSYLEQGDYNEVKINVVTKKLGGVYSLSEIIKFEVEVSSEGKDVEGDIKYVLSNDGVETLGIGIIELKNGKTEIEWSQKIPMIVRCQVLYKTKKNVEFKNWAAAAVSLYDIQPTAIEPSDFLDYWSRQKDILNNVPMNPQLNLVDENNGIKSYDLTLDNVNGSKVHAYFSIPKDEGPFPALLLIPGAGVVKRSFSSTRNYASKGMMTLQVGIHDLLNGMSDSFYEEKKNGELKDYYLQGRENRDTYYFHRVVLECIRAIDYLTSRSDWDEEHMTVSGSSQGGGLTLITTGLDKRVTAAAANVPALSDHPGRNFGRPSGWPQLVPEGSNGKLDPNILKVAEYYDAVNFAKYVDVPVVLGVGLIDNTCHPTTVFSAFNQIKSEKEIDIAPLMGHDFSPAFIKLREAFIMEQGYN